MKKLLLIILIAVGFNSFAQKDTLTENSTGYEFELYKQTMFVVMDSDTVKSAEFLANKNQLPWGNTPMQYGSEVVNISDSIIDLLKISFQGIVSSIGASSFEDDYGIYSLTGIDVKYSTDSVSSITCLYKKQLKAPNGSLTERSISYNNTLSKEHVSVFEELLLNTEVRSLYLDWYNEILGNE